MAKATLQGDEYGLVGRPESGYSVKVLAAMRYKCVAHQWMDRFRNNKCYKQHARVQLIPLVFLPEGGAMQDSTPILELLEERYPEPSIHPSDPALRFLSDLLEEYGDEWANKLMFHYRWGYPADQKRRSRSLAAGMIGGFTAGWVGKLLGPVVAPLLVKRMVPRMAFAGSNANNKPILVASFAKLVDMLEVHLKLRSYLLGERPSFGDFGLWGQLYQSYLDPSCCDILEARAPAVVDWIQRMLAPENSGDFESLEALSPTLLPIFQHEVGPHFLAWSCANAKAWAAGEAQTELAMDGQSYSQKTFKYPAQGFATVQKKFAGANGNEGLTSFLQAADCLQYFADAE